MKSTAVVTDARIPTACRDCTLGLNLCTAKVIGTGLRGRASLKCLLWRTALRCDACRKPCDSCEHQHPGSWSGMAFHV